MVLAFGRGASANIVFYATLVQSQMSHKIKGPDGTGVQSKGVYEHTCDQNISHNKNRLLRKNKILGDLKITATKFKRASRIKTDSKQKAGDFKKEHHKDKKIKALGHF